jgi:phosphoenolpyruvate carboxylase
MQDFFFFLVRAMLYTTKVFFYIIGLPPSFIDTKPSSQLGSQGQHLAPFAAELHSHPGSNLQNIHSVFSLSTEAKEKLKILQLDHSHALDCLGQNPPAECSMQSVEA